MNIESLNLYNTDNISVYNNPINKNHSDTLLSRNEQNFDTYEKSENIDCYENYSKYREKFSMPESIFSDHYAWDMQTKIAYYMNDFYSGKVSQSDLENFFKKCCESMRIYRTQKHQTTGNNLNDNKQILSQMYEFFAMDNLRAANRANEIEGDIQTQKYGGVQRYLVYYNSDYYYKCQDTKMLLRDFLKNVEGDWDLPSIDPQKIEDNSRKHYADGKFSFNILWNDTFKSSLKNAKIENVNFVPPKNFKLFFNINASNGDRILNICSDKDNYDFDAPFTIGYYGILGTQEFDLNELLSELSISKKSKNQKSQKDIFIGLPVLTKWYSFKSNKNHFWGIMYYVEGDRKYHFKSF
ncbi:hypothetical protein SAMN05216249_11439 [Acetitomaculum ruminis DSM 5522]|uniref:Uncharacterized protein n=1 Tax=Acetitomaculum ruminis DSM 5522 TaxID=1120918 RepID=A0A1I0ZF14_9FIRM|nr:hypothetical protein [Acetitomaculum ruminis]SFB23120.1 hypothetical protein SAMN05216249_11439 [Acetitomaculum ruminis DSM 5522]